MSWRSYAVRLIWSYPSLCMMYKNGWMQGMTVEIIARDEIAKLRHCTFVQVPKRITHPCIHMTQNKVV